MPQNAEFHYTSAQFAKTKSIFRVINLMEIIAYDSSIKTMDHLYLTVSNLMGKSIGLQRVIERNKLENIICCKYQITGFCFFVCLI